MSQIARGRKRHRRKAQLDALDKALQSYRLDMGRFPRQGEGLAALVNNASGEARWRGPYLQGDLPMDPWGHPYGYQTPGLRGKDYRLFSFGRDGGPGGSAEDADIER